MSKVRKSLLACAAAAGALTIGAVPALSAAAPGPAIPGTTAAGPVAASPYLYNGWGSPPKPGEVLTIEAQSQAPEKMFFKLYVQIFEQFGATVLDEHVHQFFTPREFRTRVAC